MWGCYSRGGSPLGAGGRVKCRQSKYPSCNEIIYRVKYYTRIFTPRGIIHKSMHTHKLYYNKFKKKRIFGILCIFSTNG